MDRYNRRWQNTQSQSGIRYKCGYCGTDTTPSSGWNTDNSSGHIGYVLICTMCNRPSFIHTHGGQVRYITPASKIGESIEGLPDDVGALYNEARECTSSNAFTSAILTSRKILMHVAVEKGADEGKSFVSYVEYLANNNYIPPDGKDWVDHIRSKSNEANHEIVIMNKEDADDLLTFTEMLLRLVYEFPHRLSISANENDA